MTLNRKADLQRKLTMAPVAKPPAGLADRIKSDIPEHFVFQAESERRRFRKSTMFNLRIAASIILLVSSVYLALHLVSQNGANIDTRSMMTTKDIAAPAPRVAVALPNTPPAPGSARVPEHTDLPPLPRVPPPTRIAAQPPRERIAEAKHEESVAMSTATPVYIADAGQTMPITESTSIVNAVPAAPIAAPAPPPPAAEAPVMTADGGAARERTFAKSSAADSLNAPPSAPPVHNFYAIQQAISHGETPRDADTYAFVQHFAAPERKPADLRVDLEASAAPLDSTKWLLRVSVDAPGKTSAPIELTFGDAVAVHRPMTGSVAANETALYEIEFKPNAKTDETIATVRAGDAKSTLRVADLRHWNEASSRMKRVSLAAAWARALQSKKQTEEIVAKAREAHIDELADIAEQSVRYR
ncbi:MAG TPA: hypothetical protein VGQ21_08285 [Thermoanaerobaculia bacterium]|jgi:hypothetical protein|nr:hypothetical protein [Thermoanaerobaculia bacterium]